MNNTAWRVTHWIQWYVFSRNMVRFVLKPWYNFLKTRDSDRIPEPPFVIVANHGTFFDPWFIGLYSTAPTSYMTNDDGFRGSPVIRWYLRTVGSFPKKKGASDYKAMKELLRRLARKSPVCVFPEGQTSWDGETQTIYRGLERVVKRAGCPLVMVRLTGSFLTKPWWAYTKRKGRILIRFKVLPAEKIQGMSEDELFLAIKENIYHNDIKDEENRAVPFSGYRLAEGLERFVWICMHCRTEDMLVAGDNIITCSQCGKSWDFDAYCRLWPRQQDTTSLADLKEWSEWHKKEVLSRISSAGDDTVITASGDVTFQTVEPGGYRFVDRAIGALSLTRKTLVFSPRNESLGTFTANTREARDFVIQKKDIFEFRLGENYYRFMFNRHSPMKWVWYLRYLNGYREFEERGYL